MSEIPAAVLAGLNAGTTETITLVEWLAIDVRRLARAVATGALSRSAAIAFVAAADRLATEGVTRRTKGMGVAIHEALAGLAPASKRKAFDRLAGHPSDVVRGWTAYAVSADGTHPLPARLALARRFAADSHMAVRECAWDAIRPHVVADLDAGLALLAPWVADADPNVRRTAIESTRPRGVWTTHVEALKARPERAAHLLEPCRSDTSLYVRNAVANWLNDASKSRPAWVRSLCARWTRESPTKETAYVVRRAMRTLTASEEGPRAPRPRPRREPRAAG